MNCVVNRDMTEKLSSPVDYAMIMDRFSVMKGAISRQVRREEMFKTGMLCPSFLFDHLHHFWRELTMPLHCSQSMCTLLHIRTNTKPASWDFESA